MDALLAMLLDILTVLLAPVLYVWGKKRKQSKASVDAFLGKDSRLCQATVTDLRSEEYRYGKDAGRSKTIYSLIYEYLIEEDGITRHYCGKHFVGDEDDVDALHRMAIGKSVTVRYLTE